MTAVNAVHVLDDFLEGILAAIIFLNYSNNPIAVENVPSEFKNLLKSLHEKDIIFEGML